MKWVNLLWSVVILTGITFFSIRMAERSAGPISPVFGSAVIVWIACIIISPVILLLRIFRVIKNSHSFIYIFIGTTNLMIGVAGLYNALDHAVKIYYSFIALAGINVLLGLFIFIDVFIKTIPGYRNADGQT